MSWNTQSLGHGDLELILLPQIGGRLMDIIFRGESLLFQNPDLAGSIPDLERLQELPSRARHLPFPLWGGEKTWIAPDTCWPDGAPYPVLDSGEYSFRRLGEHNVEMSSQVCPISNLQITRTVELQLPDRWSIEHRVLNTSKEPRKVGLWSVMMTKRPAAYFFPAGNDQEPKTVFGEPGHAYTRSNGIGQIRCDAQREFKLGFHPASGVSAARIAGEKQDVWILNHVDTLSHQHDYAHAQALEFYNSGHYHYGELEWHSQALLLQPEHSHQFTLGYQVFAAMDDVSPAEMMARVAARHEETQ